MSESHPNAQKLLSRAQEFFNEVQDLSADPIAALPHLETNKRQNPRPRPRKIPQQKLRPRHTLLRRLQPTSATRPHRRLGCERRARRAQVPAQSHLRAVGRNTLFQHHRGLHGQPGRLPRTVPCASVRRDQPRDPAGRDRRDHGHGGVDGRGVDVAGAWDAPLSRGEGGCAGGVVLFACGEDLL